MATIIPTLRYRDAGTAMDLLERAFGFERRHLSAGDDGKVEHAELMHGDGLVMLGSVRDDDAFTTSRNVTYVVVDDVDGHHDRTVAAGAEVTMELTDQPYGSREYGVTDHEGHVWTFGTYDPFAT